MSLEEIKQYRDPNNVYSFMMTVNGKVIKYVSQYQWNLYYQLKEKNIWNFENYYNEINYDPINEQSQDNGVYSKVYCSKVEDYIASEMNHPFIRWEAVC